MIDYTPRLFPVLACSAVLACLLQTQLNAQPRVLHDEPVREVKGTVYDFTPLYMWGTSVLAFAQAPEEFFRNPAGRMEGIPRFDPNRMPKGIPMGMTWALIARATVHSNLWSARLNGDDVDLSSDSLRDQLCLSNTTSPAGASISARLSADLKLRLTKYPRAGAAAKTAPASTRQKAGPIEAAVTPEQEQSMVRWRLAMELNALITGDSLYNEEQFRTVRLDSEADTLLRTGPKGKALERLNRLLLSAALPDLKLPPFGPAGDVRLCDVSVITSEGFCEFQRVAWVHHHPFAEYLQTGDKLECTSYLNGPARAKETPRNVLLVVARTGSDWLTLHGVSFGMRFYDHGTLAAGGANSGDASIGGPKFDYGRILTAPEKEAYRAEQERINQVARENWKKIMAEREQKRKTALEESNRRVFHYYLQRAETNSADARSQFELGERYLKGIGVESNAPLSRFWLLRAATNGFPEASNLLQRCGWLP
jgi:hypothetical protein